MATETIDHGVVLWCKTASPCGFVIDVYARWMDDGVVLLVGKVPSVRFRAEATCRSGDMEADPGLVLDRFLAFMDRQMAPRRGGGGGHNDG